MKLAVISANGRSGRLIVEEAVDRGIDVTAIARNEENTTSTEKYLQKDLMNLTKNDLKEFDVVIDAFGTWENDKLALHSTTLKHLCDILSKSKTRLIVVGGAGSLYTNKEHTKQIAEAKDFPDMYKPVANAMKNALEELRQRNDVRWTYISPALDFQPEGKRTGEYILAGEELKFNNANESIISYADYAIAIIDEATKGNHIQKRISVLKK
ncbi:hypothetical protein LT336_00081 [Spiroplasma sp. JKS002671]|uniref:NAD(P)-dependent oxidoreductase n=1 Tax=Spiroplasma attinicola TaxID=2904537 RepID=UPI002022B64B|nr:NAD(P)H-binding protein [Spiroplasma sp. JKS002671]MCL8210351.1 hypothetical protein [Spiroplasma sp. JKS002671]